MVRLALAFLAFAATIVASTAQGGLAFDACEHGDTCRKGLECRTGAADLVCAPNASNCACLPPDGKHTACSASFDCVKGERCVLSEGQKFCASCKFWAANLPNGTIPVDRDAETCLPDGKKFLSGYTGDGCGALFLSKCVAPRECYLNTVAQNFIRCDEVEDDDKRLQCQCRDDDVQSCIASVDCPYGERCVRRGTSGFCASCRAVAIEVGLLPIDDDESRCLLPKFTPSPSPAPGTFERAPYRGGFAWDNCTADPAKESPTLTTKCPEYLKCLSTKHFLPTPCEKGDSHCFCSNNPVRRCIVSSHCPLGERCIRVLDNRTETEDLKVCAGCQNALVQSQLGAWEIFGSDENCIPLKAADSPSPSPSSSPPPEPKESYPQGLTFGQCAGKDRNTICKGTRRCRFAAENRRCGAEDTDCVCEIPGSEPVACEVSSDCDGGERCFNVADRGQVCAACSAFDASVAVDEGEANCRKDTRSDGGGTTSKPSRTPVSASTSTEATAAGTSTMTAGPTSSSGQASAASPFANVCIAAHHLGGLRRDGLVFAAHRTATVHCDARGSCATPGHMVVFRGQAMRMRTYCEEFAGSGCTVARMAVNSPRWPACRRVASRTDGLEFTALAARWETAVEEGLLRTALRLGA